MGVIVGVTQSAESLDHGNVCDIHRRPCGNRIDHRQERPAPTNHYTVMGLKHSGQVFCGTRSDFTGDSGFMIVGGGFDN